MKKSKSVAQSIIEYTMGVVIVIAALLAISWFLRTRVQANWQESADTFGSGRQFERDVTVTTNTVIVD